METKLIEQKYQECPKCKEQFLVKQGQQRTICYNCEAIDNPEAKHRRAKKLPVFVSEEDLLKILQVAKHKHEVLVQ